MMKFNQGLFVCATCVCIWVMCPADATEEHESLTPDANVSARFVEFNPVVPLGFGLQITVPLSFFMPKFGFLSEIRRDSDGGSYSARNSKARTWSKHPSSSLRCPLWMPPLEDYLHLLHIDTESCQKRFICEVASNPQLFRPLSDILLKKITLYKSDKWEPWLGGESSNQYSHWLGRAATVGVKSKGSHCLTHFPECPFSAESMVDVSLLGWWHLLQQMFNIRIIEENDMNSIG